MHRIASRHFYSDYVAFCLIEVCDYSVSRSRSFLQLLGRAVVLFMAGEYVDTLSQVSNLITGVFFHSMFYVVQVRG